MVTLLALTSRSLRFLCRSVSHGQHMAGTSNATKNRRRSISQHPSSSAKCPPSTLMHLYTLTTRTNDRLRQPFSQIHTTTNLYLTKAYVHQTYLKSSPQSTHLMSKTYNPLEGSADIHLEFLWNITDKQLTLFVYGANLSSILQIDLTWTQIY